MLRLVIGLLLTGMFALVGVLAFELELFVCCVWLGC